MEINELDFEELKPIPELELGDEREVYAFYGLAAFHAQCAEKSLVNFAMGYRVLDETILTQEQWLEIYDKTNDKTFGRLLGEVKSKAGLSHDLKIYLEDALRKRNWLAHDFFYDYASHFSDFEGRVEMINELQRLIRTFQIADHEIEKLSLKIWEKFGVTEEWIQTEMMAQLAEYNLR
ncbi:hypothetical protein [Aeromonas veronii]|uniref:hypothetical protein n=1 Tax=Aeromonas veronii TaxID=654 RepID=UPI001F2DD617|nr:hypothetical protein [Aeromonas veronii]MCF5888247.1 hypothetical protein [Aeromonas veronii]